MPKGVYERLSEEDRFLKYVNKTETCWLWTASCDEDGYGRFTSPERTAHRFAYRFYKEPIEEGMMVLHSCDNPTCCNPEHLSVGTAKDNMDDCMNRGRYKLTTGAFKPGDTVGELNGRAKLTIDAVTAIRARHTAGLKYGELKQMATEYGIAYITIQKIVANKLWKE
jgi:hypothetical protein